ncbi:hypothetical protein ACA29_22235 [Lederbergia galactosidilytica]|uniref:Xylose isomerase n=1 Tax=Lederbergia galactosidilytica TaxID=217031 RepID=A0A0Q9XNG7_9BACI|nr:hypothetical protein ACA29_22235 [Lederbergia galactosidilytica]
MVNHITQEGLNIAYSPEIWEVLFETVPSTKLGLEIDPAHMVWQGIDYVKARTGSTYRAIWTIV